MNTSACGAGSILVSRSKAARKWATVSIAPYCRATPARRWVSLTWAITWVGDASWPNWITRRAYGRSHSTRCETDLEAPVNKAVLHSMTDAERRLVAETEPAAIAELDEEELLELHTRIRRARGKYVKNYRRAASAKVGARGSRGKAFAGSQRDRDKAEVFELSLARVSRQVAKAAAQTAAELKEERLAAARVGTGTPAVAKTGRARSATANPSSKRGATKTTGGLKRDASSRAQGARRQGKRDAR